MMAPSARVGSGFIGRRHPPARFALALMCQRVDSSDRSPRDRLPNRSAGTVSPPEYKTNADRDGHGGKSRGRDARLDRGASAVPALQLISEATMRRSTAIAALTIAIIELLRA